MPDEVDTPDELLCGTYMEPLAEIDESRCNGTS